LEFRDEETTKIAKRIPEHAMVAKSARRNILNESTSCTKTPHQTEAAVEVRMNQASHPDAVAEFLAENLARCCRILIKGLRGEVTPLRRPYCSQSCQDSALHRVAHPLPRKGIDEASCITHQKHPIARYGPLKPGSRKRVAANIPKRTEAQTSLSSQQLGKPSEHA
jgi:hypothetical protein